MSNPPQGCITMIGRLYIYPCLFNIIHSSIWKKLSGIIAKHKIFRLYDVNDVDDDDVHTVMIAMTAFIKSACMWVGRGTTPWVREGLPSPFEREVANLGACLASSKSSHAKQATAWSCLKLTVSPSPFLRFVERRLYQTISRNCLARGWRAGADICRYLEWHGTGRQAPNSTPPPPLLPAGLGASSHPLQLVGEMEVGATATTTYYGVTQQLQGQEASPLLSFSITTFICLASSELDSQLCLLQCTV